MIKQCQDVSKRSKNEKIHFVGIGGIGMSALADILIDNGTIVSGSDTRSNNLTAMLTQKGAVVTEGHSACNVPEGTDIVVRSTCIKDDNPEILESKNLGITIVSRGEMLKRVIERSGISIGVSGTHGKTTTSGIISYITDHAGLDPTILVGGEMERFGKNSKSGQGDMVVAEIDESDGYFRNIPLTHALITNVEREHMEHYGGMGQLLDAYASFIGKVSSSGVFVFNGDDNVLRELSEKTFAEKISFGISPNNDAVCEIKQYRKKIEFDMFLRGKFLCNIRSPLVGLHNVSNILGAAVLCAKIGIDPIVISQAVELFSGVKRRFETVGQIGGIRVIEDYAHHPTELRSVIRAAKEFSDNRVISVFQPHRYSRTLDLEKEFAGCFYSSDILFLTDIYSADEEPLEKVNIERLFNLIDKSRFEFVRLIEKGSLPEAVAEVVRENDTVLILGAGDIREISSVLTTLIRRKMVEVS